MPAIISLMSYSVPGRYQAFISTGNSEFGQVRIHGSDSADTHRHLAVSARHNCTQFMVCGLESGPKTRPSKLFKKVKECDLLLYVCALLTHSSEQTCTFRIHFVF